MSAALLPYSQDNVQEKGDGTILRGPDEGLTGLWEMSDFFLAKAKVTAVTTPEHREAMIAYFD